MTDPLTSPPAVVPDGDDWVPASTRLVRARIVTALVVTPLPIAAGAVLATLVSPWWWFLAAPFALGLASTLLRSRRYVAALGHVERAEELVVREGLWSRTATVIPYGRLQYVTLTEGPIDTRFGLAKLEVHTAASGSTTVPGLPVADARALRSRLSRRTRGRDEGL
ncbi:PH domain-containing protein [Serinibacter arcticus]|uniref:Transmembrane protein, distant homology with ydbS n=1 Tax=Serinibacter arcticus TaxID=1655435 RepID=A0A4Z1DWN0_9MICO|nr:PH domain-containing protein [Serinibacter arcticus]TGO03914.1 transmembrane protein, distant homology with ydbS [Serinibacter arcticus]